MQTPSIPPPSVPIAIPNSNTEESHIPRHVMEVLQNTTPNSTTTSPSSTNITHLQKNYLSVPNPLKTPRSFIKRSWSPSRRPMGTQKLKTVSAANFTVPKSLSVCIGNHIIELSFKTTQACKLNIPNDSFVALVDTSLEIVKLADKIVEKDLYNLIDEENVIPLKNLAKSLQIKLLSDACKSYIKNTIFDLKFKPEVLLNSNWMIRSFCLVQQKTSNIPPEIIRCVNALFRKEDLSLITSKNVKELEVLARELEIPKLTRYIEKAKIRGL